MCDLFSFERYHTSWAKFMQHIFSCGSHKIKNDTPHVLKWWNGLRASSRWFFPVEVDASFRRFSWGSQTRFGTSGELLIHEKGSGTFIFVQCRHRLHSFTVDHESGSDFLLRGAQEHLPLHDIYHALVGAYTVKVQIFGKSVKVAYQLQ